ncbi:MAG: hypothetical protein A2945_01995 [Candidatus Liptonbacteria bacterium RIFCSPLOWO2_01_FULL_52_25]|uniref:Uncharacterized protein n=1 Tax=Candidatus Liptonbacteria bacterium RIFCSPLOWO2_01_FULL_52_25 TaxID=1798650 RepID=A0A1G2CEC2_9BACT|nr:MAG: hypothetical protein A2945_01995 [Candidatus Liptonbacteria bacterium RIFCSPLOWO2_01_FULL_52_25]
MRSRYLLWSLSFLAIVLVSAPTMLAQGTIPSKPSPPVRPVITGFATSDVSLFSGGRQVNFGANPILLVPTWKEGLFLAELETGYGLSRERGMWEREFEYEIEYLQLNQRVFKNHTLVTGKFLTPGMWNERLHPSWIKKTSDTPFSAGLLEHDGVGLMLRGVVPIKRNINFSYSPFFTAAIQNRYFGSERMVGGRAGTYFKTQGLDLGFLAARTLQGERSTITGVDWTKQFRGIALDLRGEYYRGHDGSAYWVELAKHFKNSRLRKFELVARFEQAFVRADSDGHDEGIVVDDDHDEEVEVMEEDGGRVEEMPAEDSDHDEAAEESDEHDEVSETEEGHAEAEGEGHGGFPERNTNRLIGTVNYYIRDGFKVYFSTGLEVAPGTGERKKAIGFGLAFRF